MRTAIIALALLILFSGAVPLPPGWAMEPDWEQLNQNQVQTAIEPYETDEGVKKRGVAMVILPAGIEKAWELVSDWDSMGDYVPNLKYYKTIHRAETEKFIAGRLRIMFVNIDYPLWVQFDHEKYNHTWRMLKEDELPAIELRGIKGLVPAHFAIKDITGFWQLKPIDENKTLFLYSALVSAKFVPESVMTYVSKLTLPNFLAAVRQRLIDQLEAENTP